MIPPIGAAHVDVFPAQEVEILLAGKVVLAAFFRAEGHFQGNHLIRRQGFALEGMNIRLVAELAHQAVEHLLLAIGPLRGGGEAEAEGGNAADGGILILLPGQVMAFVEHQKAEAVALAGNMQEGGVVGRHRQRRDLLVAPAQQADLLVEITLQHRVPLVHQVDGRHVHQGGTAGLLDQHHRQDGLAGAGGQGHHPAPSVVDPGGQRLLLVGPGDDAFLQRKILRFELPGFIAVGQLLAVQQQHDLAVEMGRGAVGAAALIPLDAAGLAQGLGEILENKGAFVEVDFGHGNDYLRSKIIRRASSIASKTSVSRMPRILTRRKRWSIGRVCKQSATDFLVNPFFEEG